MNITYFHRHPNIGFSIPKVFKIIENEIRLNNTIKDVYMPTQRSLPWNVIINVLVTFFHRNPKGINHISGHIHDSILGLIGCKTVLTIHDVAFMDRTQNPIKCLYKWLLWLYIPIKVANSVSCVSTKTKQNILKYIKTDKLTVIYNPIDPSFRYVKKEFNAKEPIILHIGTGWNKNLSRSIEALKGISCHFRIIGIINTDTEALLTKYDIKYSSACNLSDEEIRQEYIRCDIVSFPSIYEGFGMPIIEGQKTGRVVLTSQIEPLTEISGGAAQYVDPYDITSIRNGYLEIINNRYHRDNLILKGIVNAQRFDSKVIARQYIDLYTRLMK